MANWFLDFVGGNDSNDGSSFALRKKTLASFTSGPATNDTIRVMGNAPYSLSQNATWTRGNTLVTLASAVTQTLYADGAWTFGTAATASTTDAANKKEGANSSTTTLKSATTGQAAFLATGTLDLSAYQRVSFWIRTGAAVAANSIRFDLCSDTAGATPVTSYTIPFATTAFFWHLVTFDNGSALSSSIKSINLQILSGISPVTSINIDDVVACKARGSGPTLASLVGLNDGFWYPIQSINGTSLYLDQDGSTLATNGRGWWNPNQTTGSYTIYCIDPVAQVANLQANAALATTNNVNISGGWDTTNMTTQPAGALTILDYQVNSSGTTAGWAFNGKTQSNTISNVGTARSGFGIFIGTGTSTANVTIQNCHTAGCGTGFMFSSWETINNCNAINCGTAGFSNNNNLMFNGTQFSSCYAISCGFSVSTANVYNGGFQTGLPITSAPTGLGSQWGQVSNSSYYMKFTNCVAANNGYAGFNIQNAIANLVNCFSYDNGGSGFLHQSTALSFSCTATGNSLGGIGVGTCAGEVRYYSPTTSGNSIAAIYAYNWGTGDVKIRNGSFSEGTVASFPTNGGNANSTSTIYSEKEGGSLTTNKIYRLWGNIVSDTSTTQSGSGQSWKFSPTNTNISVSTPLRVRIGTFTVLANKTLTVNVWARRDSTNVTGTLRFIGGITPGVGSAGTDVTTSMAPSINTWTQFNISATPTENCVLELWAEAYGGTTNNFWVDTMSASST